VTTADRLLSRPFATTLRLYPRAFRARAEVGPRPAAPSRTLRAHYRPTASPPSTAAASPRPRPSTPFVQHHLETFLAHAAEADPHGEGVPRR
jgi:hypothetical protein